MECGTRNFLVPLLAVLVLNHSIAVLIGFVSHQNNRNVRQRVLAVCAQLGSASLIVVDQELEAIAIVKAALVRYGVHEYEGVRSLNVLLQRCNILFLYIRVYYINFVYSKFVVGEIILYTFRSPGASVISKLTTSLSMIVSNW